MIGTYFAVLWRYPRKYTQIIENECKKYGLETQLVQGVIWTESKFNERAKSHAGATGLMQLMPSTAEWCAGLLGIEYSEEMLYEPSYNIMLGTFYLDFLLQRFDKENAIAAYNAGLGNVKKWMNEGLEIEEYPFKETRDYVERVFSARKIYLFFSS